MDSYQIRHTPSRYSNVRVPKLIHSYPDMHTGDQKPARLAGYVLVDGDTGKSAAECKAWGNATQSELECLRSIHQ